MAILESWLLCNIYSKSINNLLIPSGPKTLFSCLVNLTFITGAAAVHVMGCGPTCVFNRDCLRWNGMHYRDSTLGGNGTVTVCILNGETVAFS